MVLDAGPADPVRAALGGRIGLGMSHCPDTPCPQRATFEVTLRHLVWRERVLSLLWVFLNLRRTCSQRAAKLTVKLCMPSESYAPSRRPLRLERLSSLSRCVGNRISRKKYVMVRAAHEYTQLDAYKDCIKEN